MLLKDNIDTADMPTTAGSVALAGSIPPDDAFITQKLRAAGAIIIGKATLTEFANFIALAMPTGYSSLGLFGFNPYDPRPLPGGDGRPVLQTGGSSSGSGIAVNANLAALAIGTETSGSILSPASANGVVGIKPTVGLVSRDGIIPITADQDTAGPIARTVRDAALLLGVIAGFDPNDAATAACLTPGNCFDDYTQFLDKKALRGVRIAVPPFPNNRAAIMNAAIAVLREQGAVVDTIPALAPQLGICVSYPAPAGLFHRAAVWAEARLECVSGGDAGRTATHARGDHRVQQYARSANEVRAGDLRSGATARHVARQRGYAALPQRSRRRPGAVRGALDAIYSEYDAILASANSFAATPAKAGYPSITVPGGFLPPDNVVVNPFPSGVTFSGPAFSEPRLIALAYAFEQATLHRRPPASTPALPTDVVRRP